MADLHVYFMQEYWNFLFGMLKGYAIHALGTHCCIFAMEWVKQNTTPTELNKCVMITEVNQVFTVELRTEPSQLDRGLERREAKKVPEP